jgi:putative hemolysin
MIELFIILLLTILNGFFSMSEIALISVKRTRLEEKARNGHKGAKSALKLLENPEKFLSAVQVGITLIGVVSGLFGGVALSDNIKPYVAQIPYLTPYATTVSFTLIVIFITYLSIVVGELFPKTLALNNTEKIALFSAPIVAVFTRFTSPIVWLLSASTNALLWIFRVKSSNENQVSEEELKAMLKLATEQGKLQQKVNEYINNIFQFDDKPLSDIMTLRKDIVWLDLQKDLAATTTTLQENNFSHYLACTGELNAVVGIIIGREFFQKRQEPTFTLSNIMHKPLYFTKHQLAFDVLENFRKTKTYFGVVTNEYGEVEGIVSLHDIIETILGQLPDTNDKARIFIQKDENTYLIDAQTRLEDLPDFIKLQPIENADYQTLAGYVLAFTQYFPAEGDKIIIGDYTFEVIDIDKGMIDKIMLTQNLTPLGTTK